MQPPPDTSRALGDKASGPQISRCYGSHIAHVLGPLHNFPLIHPANSSIQQHLLRLTIVTSGRALTARGSGANVLSFTDASFPGHCDCTWYVLGAAASGMKQGPCKIQDPTTNSTRPWEGRYLVRGTRIAPWRSTTVGSLSHGLPRPNRRPTTFSCCPVRLLLLLLLYLVTHGPIPGPPGSHPVDWWAAHMDRLPSRFRPPKTDRKAREPVYLGRPNASKRSNSEQQALDHHWRAQPPRLAPAMWQDISGAIVVPKPLGTGLVLGRCQSLKEHPKKS